MNTPPIFPQVIYPIGDLADGRFIAEVGARGFQYVRELPDLDGIEFSLLDDYDELPLLDATDVLDDTDELPLLDFDEDEPDTIPDDRDTIPSRPPWEVTDPPPTLRPEEIERQPWYRRLAWWRRAA